MITITKKPIYEAKCQRCGCYFTFDLTDMIKAGDYSSAHMDTICPHCGACVHVISGNVLNPEIKIRYVKEDLTNGK